MLSDLFLDIGALGLPGELQPMIWAVAALWLAFLLEKIGLVAIPNLQARGDIVGIITSSFGHANLAHLLSNSIGLVILMSLFLLATPSPWGGLAVFVLGSGALYWIFGPSRVQVRGASDVVYALAGWWVVFSLATGRVTGFAVVTFGMFVYGLFEAMHPFHDQGGVSATGHFYGFLAGGVWSAHSLSLFDPFLQQWS